MLTERSVAAIYRTEIVVDTTSLRVKAAVKRLIREMRDQELAEIIQKEADRCHRLTQQKQD